MSILQKQQQIGQYVVTFHIKDGAYAETYRVKDGSGKNYFLKLLDYAKLHRTQFDENNEILELILSVQLKHPNLTCFHDNGELMLGNKKLAYIVYDFISGETLAQRLARLQMLSVFDAKDIIIGVLNGVKYLHSLPRPIIHNELTVQNVMLDMTDNSAKIIDFGYARFFDQGNKSFMKEGLNSFYMAPETFNGVFTKQSDLYSVGVMLYHLLFGMPPYFIDKSRYKADDEVADAILAERKRPLKILDCDKYGLDEQLINIMEKSMAFDADNRFSSAEEFIDALNGKIEVEPINKKKSQAEKSSENPNANIKKGNGFADVAGMEELKAQLQSDVIDLLQNPEQAKELGLTLPNGLLFYGPPGCGKTYFAEKFAEELGCNYQYVKCSDVASPYIHGGQGKIAAIFENARKNAPTILFFDEIEAMIKDRRKQNNVSEEGEVNEFLTQLNNCGASGVIVIGATNRPTLLDEAAIRAGRQENKYYIPQPDFKTRAKLFELNLSKRKTDFGIDYELLAEKTENYISADIKLVVDTAARMVFRNKTGKITMNDLLSAVQNVRPSLTIEQIREHEAIKDKFEHNKSDVERRKIGF